MTDVFSESLSFYGRVIDGLTRDPLFAPEYQVKLRAPATEAQYKADGYFTFQGLRPSATSYDFELSGSRFQTRSFQSALPPGGPVELGFDAEDELRLALKSVPSINNIGFDKIPFVPLIAKDAVALGEGGFASTLKTSLGGVDLVVASLDSTAGLMQGQLLRIVRSRRLMLKPGPYYPFPDGTTVLGIKVVESTAPETTLDAARVRILQVNGQALTPTPVSGVTLHQVSLPGPPPLTLVLGTLADLETSSDARGRAVLFFPGQWPLTALQLEVSRAGYVTQTLAPALTAGERTSISVQLVPA